MTTDLVILLVIFQQQLSGFLVQRRFGIRDDKQAFDSLHGRCVIIMNANKMSTDDSRPEHDRFHTLASNPSSACRRRSRLSSKWGGRFSRSWYLRQRRRMSDKALCQLPVSFALISATARDSPSVRSPSRPSSRCRSAPCFNAKAILQ